MYGDLLSNQYILCPILYIHTVIMRVYLSNIEKKAWRKFRLRIQIPYRPEFFSGLLFTTAKVVFITAKITLKFMSLSTVQIYDFHIFLVVYIQ